MRRAVSHPGRQIRDGAVSQVMTLGTAAWTRLGYKAHVMQLGLGNPAGTCRSLSPSLSVTTDKMLASVAQYALAIGCSLKGRMCICLCSTSCQACASKITIERSTQGTHPRAVLAWSTKLATSG